jgi:hypothetical protein
MSQRLFKLNEAQELLPFIAPHLDQARELKQKMDRLDEDLARASAQIMILGGSIPPHAELAAKRAERGRVAELLKEAVSKILQTGCLIKDLDVGLIDFPAIRGGEEVYLCWKLGEERIEYWHRVQEGFAGRKLLDDLSPGESSHGPQIQ